MENKINNRILKRAITFLAKKHKIVEVLFDNIEKELLQFQHHGYLKESGWVESYKTQTPQDSQNQPIPWVTYPYIEFIKPRLKLDMELFEYGSGASTEFYAKRVLNIDSVEHDKPWFDKINSLLPANASISFEELVYGGEYCKKTKLTSKKYDLISIDGRDRANCCIESVNALKEGGVIVLDDSEREEYKKGIDFLHANQFKALDFWGISPGLFYNKCTSIYYRSNNVLGI